MTDRVDSPRQTQQHAPEQTTPASDVDGTTAPRGRVASQATDTSDTTSDSLLEPTAASGLAGRWEHVQAGFLDSPQQAVQEADQLVQEVMRQLSERMTGQRERLQTQWRGGQDVSTEDLRRTLQRYRTFFQRLLAA